MDVHLRTQHFTAEATALENTLNLLGTLLRALVSVFTSPKGDQGGWEAGARGL